jgi:hypothetical protein
LRAAANHQPNKIGWVIGPLTQGTLQGLELILPGDGVDYAAQSDQKQTKQADREQR